MLPPTAPSTPSCGRIFHTERTLPYPASCWKRKLPFCKFSLYCTSWYQYALYAIALNF
jgi:hypothetical protein